MGDYPDNNRQRGGVRSRESYAKLSEIGPLPAPDEPMTDAQRAADAVYAVAHMLDQHGDCIPIEDRARLAAILRHQADKLADRGGDSDARDR